MKTQLENIYSSAKSDIEKAQNIADIEDVPQEVREKINFVPAINMSKVLETALI